MGVSLRAPGYLVLEDMHIKKSLLDTLELPLALRHGVIGRLEIQIPWKHLGKDPIVVAVDRVRITRPSLNAPWTDVCKRQHLLSRAATGACRQIDKTRWCFGS